MNDSDNIRNQIASLVRETSDQLHREDYFTVRLYATLWPIFGERLLYATGLDVRKISIALAGSEQIEQIRERHLSKTKDYYADLIVTEPLKNTRLASTLTLGDVLQQVKVSHLYEFKYLTSFPSLPRKVAREDAFKLKILREYVYRVSGVWPHAEQYIVASKRATRYRRPVETLVAWYDDADMRRELEGIKVSIIDVDGSIQSIL